MKKKISNLPFKGTAEQEAQLQQVIAENKHDKSNLMVVMQKAQDIYGYLPLEVQNMIAEGMEISVEKVYGVATFYAQFSLSPKVNTISPFVLVLLATLRAQAIFLISLVRDLALQVTNALLTVSFLLPLAVA